MLECVNIHFRSEEEAHADKSYGFFGPPRHFPLYFLQFCTLYLVVNNKKEEEKGGQPAEDILYLLLLNV